MPIAHDKVGQPEQKGVPAQKGMPEDFSLALPDSDKLFEVRSEEALRKRIREEFKRRGVKKTEFPADAHPSAKVIDLAQLYPPQTMQVPLAVFCFPTLYYQDVSRERDLKSWACAEPVREAFCFWGRTIVLPGLVVVAPPWRNQCWSYPFSE
jgi:hypothetical protein